LANHDSRGEEVLENLFPPMRCGTGKGQVAGCGVAPTHLLSRAGTTAQANQATLWGGTILEEAHFALFLFALSYMNINLYSFVHILTI
jgi:hypothetical protein